MPCDQIIRQTVEFKAGTDMKLMTVALEEAGYRVFKTQYGIQFSHTQKRGFGSFESGVFTVPEEWDMSAVKQGYSRASVKATAKKMGWTVKVDANDINKMQIVKRA